MRSQSNTSHSSPRKNGQKVKSPAAAAREQVIRGYSLPQYYYTSQDRYDKDIEIWRERHWLLVDHESVIPDIGNYVVRNCASESLILVRDGDKRVRALLNVCRHRGSRVCLEPRGKVKAFVCPYHAWTYNLNGTLRGARDMPEWFKAADFGLVQAHVGILHGLIFVNFSKGQPPDFAGFSQRFDPYLTYYGISGAKVAHREVFEIRANWKGLSENLFECYHCLPAHPTFSRMQAIELIPLTHDDMLQGRQRERNTELGIRLPFIIDTPNEPYFQQAGHSEIGRGRLTASVGGNPVAPLMGELKTFDGRSAGVTFNPLATLVSYPDYTWFATFVPRAPLETDMELTWLVSGKAIEGVDYDPSVVSNLWRVTTQEDRIIIGSNQAGILSSGYRPGPYSLMEQRVVDLIEWYIKHFVDPDGNGLGD